LERESHFVWGKRYLLRLVTTEQKPSVKLSHRHLILSVKQNATSEQCQALLNGWYREQIRLALPDLLTFWFARLAVAPKQIYIRQMKTKWGSCHFSNQNIRLNTELAKKPRQCLNYVLLHELCHLLEPTHNARFKSLLADNWPHWQSAQAELNALPLSHSTWRY
jgi:predicted metal-dependent hydrolase